MTDGESSQSFFEKTESKKFKHFVLQWVESHKNTPVSVYYQ